ncbi:hypothetical protein [Vulcanisaeta souniana]|nr:hypothetical protein [Vulcanisaeta souniana]
MDWKKTREFKDLQEFIRKLTELTIMPKRVIANSSELIYQSDNLEVRLSNEPRKYRGGILSGEYFIVRNR